MSDTVRTVTCRSVVGYGPPSLVAPHPVATTSVPAGALVPAPTSGWDGIEAGAGSARRRSAMSLRNVARLNRSCVTTAATARRVPPSDRSWVPTSTSTSDGWRVTSKRTMQWAAVSTQLGVMSVPPQNWAAASSPMWW